MKRTCYALSAVPVCRSGAVNALELQQRCTGVGVALSTNRERKSWTHCWSGRTLAGSCSLLAMLRCVLAGAHSRNVLSLDIETVALLLRHGERFDFRVMWKGYRDRGSWCCCWLVWSLRCCSRRCEYSSEVWCVHVGTSAALAMSAWRSASISNSPMSPSSADYRVLSHTNKSVLKIESSLTSWIVILRFYDATWHLKIAPAPFARMCQYFVVFAHRLTHRCRWNDSTALILMLFIVLVALACCEDWYQPAQHRCPLTTLGHKRFAARMQI
jgi:hypothetical protein